MADHVARMSVQLADEASSNANQVAQSLDLVTTSADKATAATVDVSAATKDFKISAIRLATPPQRWAMSRPRWRIIPARSLITLSIRHTRQYHQILPRRLGRSARGVHCRQCDLRRNHRKRSATHRNPRQRHPIREKAEPAFADNLDVQSTATDSATTSSDKLNNSTGNLAEREDRALYRDQWRQSGGHGDDREYGKIDRDLDRCGRFDRRLGRRLFRPAVPDRIGHHQATTARVCIGVVAYEIVTRSSDLATQEHALALAIAGTGQSAS